MMLQKMAASFLRQKLEDGSERKEAEPIIDQSNDQIRRTDGFI